MLERLSEDFFPSTGSRIPIRTFPCHVNCRLKLNVGEEDLISAVLVFEPDVQIFRFFQYIENVTT